MDVEDFQTEVIEASRETPVLVDFWAQWCDPCRMLSPVLEKLAAESKGGWKLAKVDTDKNPTVARQYAISSIPAVKLFVAGKVAAEFVGALPEARVREWLEEALPSETKERLQQAAAALAADDEEAAARVVELVLADDPSNGLAQALKARLLLFRDPEEARRLARSAAAAKPVLYQQSEAVETIARLLQLAEEPGRLPEEPGGEDYLEAGRALRRRDYDAALARLIEVVRRNRRLDDDGARRSCLALFNLLGEKHAATQKHRRALQMAVF